MNMRLCSILLCVAGLSFAGQTKTFNYDGMVIIALQDRANSMPNKIFHGAPEDEINAAVPEGSSPSSINAFVVKTKKHTYLIDSGMNTDTLLENLRNANVKPEEIDVILITHMHADHIGGLLKEGKAAFPKATLHIAREEYFYWRQANPNIKRLINAYIKQYEPFVYGENLPIKRVEQTETEKNIALIRKKPAARIIEMTDDAFQGRDASGHTPGHTVFESNKMIFFGDLLHSAALQFADPNICAQFDMDTKKAVQSRRKFFDHAAETKKLVLCAHLPFPGIGYVLKDEGDHYSFQPIDASQEQIIDKTK
jgi:glyoxylase-like metal-dependent hydrolase (beta-lactamase superfamily II)